MKTTYFTYRIKWSKMDMSYYGVRYKDNSDESTLMKTYFTSSKYVHNFIKEKGLPDIIEIRKRFDTKIEAKRWEERVISRSKLYKSEKWLNKGNNNSFKGIVMDEDIKDSISKSKLINSKKRGKRKIYNNGVINILLSENDIIPDGFKLGRISSEKQKEHIKELNEFLKNQSNEEKQIRYDKLSAKTHGKPKPIGFGEKVSKASKGKPKPWALGDMNPSKTQSSREKIAKSWEHRERGCVWVYNKLTGETIYVRPSDNKLEYLLSLGYVRGKPAIGKWFNDGINNYWVKNNEPHKSQNLFSGKINNGKNNTQ